MEAALKKWPVKSMEAEGKWILYNDKKLINECYHNYWILRTLYSIPFMEPEDTPLPPQLLPMPTIFLTTHDLTVSNGKLWNGTQLLTLFMVTNFLIVYSSQPRLKNCHVQRQAIESKAWVVLEVGGTTLGHVRKWHRHSLQKSLNKLGVTLTGTEIHFNIFI